MSLGYLNYELQNAYVHNWLVVGPQIVPVDALTDSPATAEWDDATRLGPDTRLAIAQALAYPEPEIGDQPAEPAAVNEGIVTIGDYQGRWRYVRCLEDHFVDLSSATGQGNYLRAWAYTELESSEAQAMMLTLTTTGPADLWLNGRHIHQSLHVGNGRRHQVLQVDLQTGRNQVLVRFGTFGAVPIPFLMALRVAPVNAALPSPAVALPTLVSRLDRRALLEEVFQAAISRQYVFARRDTIGFEWPAAAEVGLPPQVSISLTIRIQTPEGKVYSEAERTAAGEAKAEIKPAYIYPTGAMEALIMPRPQEYYEGNMRISRTVPFWSMDNNEYTAAPTGTYPERRQEILLAAARREVNIFSELAKMAIDLWRFVDVTAIEQAVAKVSQGGPSTYADLLGLLAMVYRFGEAEQFPTEIGKTLKTAVLGASFDTVADRAPESQKLLMATCELLAGQLYPSDSFALSGENGAWHQTRGEERVLDWMRARGTHGFQAWHSDIVFAETLLALSNLVDLADADPVWQTATVLLDKALFLLAANSFKGVFGASRGYTSASGLLGGYLERTSGIAKLVFGMGVLNVHIDAPVSMALMEHYQLPVMLQTIATDLPEVLVSRERHTAVEAAAPVDVSTITYKTPDYMICAAQDTFALRDATHDARESGDPTHLWQATLGPGATVFVNHPVCASLDDAHPQNFWCGNGALPRVVQWEDALVALYELPEDDWMGFTHAYFPVHAFDEYVLRDEWAFARKDDGYLAITASQGLTLMQTGETAYRELRSAGRQNVWRCQMGRAATDGDFAAFQAQVLALPVVFEESGVRWTTLRGAALSLDPTGSCLVDGEPISFELDTHIDNAYCVTEFPAGLIDIRYDDVVMRLDFTENAS